MAATLSRVDGRLLITEPKSPRSRRSVPLSPAVVSLLKAQRAAQVAERLRAVNQWQDSGLVFTTEFGTPVEPRNILRTLELAAAKAGFEKRRRAHAEALRCGGVAGVRCPHQGGGRAARAQQHSGHRRHLRPHIGCDHPPRYRRPDQHSWPLVRAYDGAARRAWRISQCPY